ncbi:MAG: M20/M25/M40 family metallo-hydrolase, partial [Pseudomonadota bacterium]
VAADCLVRFGFRGLPGADTSSRLKELQDIAGSQVSLFEKRFEGPPLPVADPAVQQGQIDLMAWATAKELTVGEPVHFWTEASLFAAGGYPALVLGPGNIAQAHTADEYVHYADLSAAFEAYSRIVSHG